MCSTETAAEEASPVLEDQVRFSQIKVSSWSKPKLKDENEEKHHFHSLIKTLREPVKLLLQVSWGGRVPDGRRCSADKPSL